MKDKSFSISSSWDDRAQGFVYFFRREDGLIKIGKTNDVQARFRKWEKDYDQPLEFIFAFFTPYMNEVESFILKQTKHLTPRGFKPSWELRDISEAELQKIIDWLRRIIQRENLGKEIGWEHPEFPTEARDLQIELTLYAGLDGDIAHWLNNNRDKAGYLIRKAIRTEMNRMRGQK